MHSIKKLKKKSTYELLMTAKLEIIGKKTNQRLICYQYRYNVVGKNTQIKNIYTD